MQAFGVLRRVRLALIAASALVALSSVSRAAPGPSPAVFPPQQLPIKFSHKNHMALKLQCDFCHENAESSVASADSLVPDEDTCASCHKIDRDQPLKESKPGARCDTCHVGPDPVNPPRVDIPPPNLKFNHKVHVDQQVSCDTCHGSMKDVDLATRNDLPRMPLCLTCHNQIVGKKRAPAKCTTCHPSGVDGTLVTDFPSGTLVPSGNFKGEAHTADFATRHAQVAARDEKYCLNCHRQDFCQTCHNGVVKPMAFHGNDYIELHAIDARKATLRCDGCHRKQTFCLGCHERVGLVDSKAVVGGQQIFDTPNSIANANRRFHPAYERWVLPPRTPEHHAWQAERNIRQCVSCHREETCLECHASQGISVTGTGSTGPKGSPTNRGFNIDPHPPGFAGSGECNALRTHNGRVCLKCHGPSDHVLINCRP